MRGVDIRSPLVSGRIRHSVLRVVFLRARFVEGEVAGGKSEDPDKSVGEGRRAWW